jgi:DNA processing protein
MADAIEHIASRVHRMPSVKRADIAAAFDAADRQIDECESAGVRVIAFGESLFPARLRSIDDAPLVLFFRSSVPIRWVDPTIAIIGTREPTEFGRRSGHRFAQRAAEAAVAVVSGLAVGCDAAAHRGCLDSQGRTFAVLAHGLDSVYPASHRELAEEIVDRGGMLISEYALGVKARANYFVERDRLQSGLSDGVIVVETDVEGGTMHTVGYAIKQMRLLAALQHPEHLLGEPKSRGNQRLIREGRAVPLPDSQSLAEFMSRVRERAASPLAMEAEHVGSHAPASPTPPAAGSADAVATARGTGGKKRGKGGTKREDDSGRLF